MPKAETYEVLYQLPGSSFTFYERALTVAGLRQTHVPVVRLEARSLDDVYLKMQGENWSPNGEARALIQRLGLNHTSMSVNDVIRDPDGGLWQCLFNGWQKIN